MNGVSQPFAGAKLSIATLPTRSGSVRDYQLELAAPDDLGTQVMTVPAGQVIPVDVTVTSMEDGVLLQIQADASARAECVRCLRPVSQGVHVDVHEMLFTPEAVARIRKEDGDEAVEDLVVLEGDEIELEPWLRDAIVTSFPYAPLCKPDCEGLCDVCGKRWEDLPDDHEHEVLDPRFSALKDFFKED